MPNPDDIERACRDGLPVDEPFSGQLHCGAWLYWTFDVTDVDGYDSAVESTRGRVRELIAMARPDEYEIDTLEQA